MELKIVNRSKWPDWFVKPVVRWVVRQTGINWRYTVELPSYARDGYCGRAYGSWKQRTRINRRLGAVAISRQEHRFITGQIRQPANRLEAFVWIVGHEARHATDANQVKFEGWSDGRRNVVAGEHDANEWGNEMVRRFRLAWPAMKAKMLAGLRAERSRAVVARIGPSRGDRIAEAQTALDRWESKAKRAATFIRKYRRRIAALHRAERMAACKK